MKKILFTGGGSAGHVMPNIALMEEILSDGRADVCYMGTDGIEKRLIEEWNIPFYQIDCPKLYRGGVQNWKKNFKIPVAFHRAQKQAEEGLRIFQPDAVFSKGGYVALPVIFAASKLKIPCFAHESDYSLGLANRLSLCKCKTIFTSFPETARRLRKGVYSGAPLRKSLFGATKAESRKKFGIPFHEKVILVFGGGSGSEIINTALRKHIKVLTEEYVILHVCGKGNLIKTNLQNYHQFEFITDMGAAYACADLIISRAGAGAIFEILALKKPAIFIPLEGQTRGDQIENAAYFSQKGLCRVIKQDHLDTLPNVITKTFSDEHLKERLAACNYTSGNEIILRTLFHALKK